MRSSWQGSSLNPSTTPPSSVAVIVCCDDHQKVKGCLPRHDSWGFILRLMQSGGALMCSDGSVHIVVTWHVMAGGVNAPLVWLFGFLVGFQFFCVWFLNFPSLTFLSSLFLFLHHCCSMPFLLRAILSYDFLHSLWVPFFFEGMVPSPLFILRSISNL